MLRNIIFFIKIYLTRHGGAGEEWEEAAAECAGGGAGLAIAGVFAVVTSKGAAQESPLLLRPLFPASKQLCWIDDKKYDEWW